VHRLVAYQELLGQYPSDPVNGPDVMLAGFGIDPIGERVAEDRPDDVLGHEQFRGETICLSFPGFVIRVFFLILGIVLEGKNPSLGEFGANLIRMKQEMPQFVGKGEALSWDWIVGVDK
jgi:hypothetical protein